MDLGTHQKGASDGVDFTEGREGEEEETALRARGYACGIEVEGLGGRRGGARVKERRKKENFSFLN